MSRITRQTFWPLLTATSLVLASSAFAQAPTDAQRAAIKSSCRSDYMAHCSSIPPGGAASLQCLQQNMSSLSAACAGAVKAVSAPSETKADTPAAPKEETKQETAPASPAAAPAAEAEKPAAEPAATPATKSAAARKPSSAQIAAVRSSCRSDYMAHCSSIPPGGAASLQCLAKNKDKLSAACGKAVAAATGGSSAPATANSAAPASADAAPAATAPAAAAAPPPLALRPMRPREVLFVMRSACGADVRTLCAGVEPGGGRIIECLATQSASLSQPCRDVLSQFAQ
jgi:hypothetical protein